MDIIGFWTGSLRLWRRSNAPKYRKYEAAARERIDYRDPDDWPILAASLLLACPIWTEDQDFFGTGVATWVTRNVELSCQGS